MDQKDCKASGVESLHWCKSATNAFWILIVMPASKFLWALMQISKVEFVFEAKQTIVKITISDL